MSTWTAEELAKVAGAEELRIISVRSDGTKSSTRTIWVVPLAEDLYVRSVNGPGSAWFRGVTQRHEGHICAGGVDRDVTFVETHDDDEGIDAAYRAKYHRYAEVILDHITSPEARSTTLRLVPR